MAQREASGQNIQLMWENTSNLVLMSHILDVVHGCGNVLSGKSIYRSSCNQQVSIFRFLVGFRDVKIGILINFYIFNKLFQPLQRKWIVLNVQVMVTLLHSIAM